MQKGEVSQTFAVNTSQTVKTNVVNDQSGDNSDTTLSFMALLSPEADKNTTTTEENNTTISQDIASVMKDQKQVLSESQNALLR